MTEAMEAKKALQEILEEATTSEHSRLDKMLKEHMSKIEDIEEFKENRELFAKSARDFREKCLTESLVTALEGIYISALQECAAITESELKLADSLIRGYIEECGGAKAVLRKLEGKTYLAGTIAKICEDAAEEAETTASQEDKEFNEVPEEKTTEEVLDKMENEEESENAVKIIATKIADAEEEFIKKNAEDKKKIEDIVTNLNNRIAAIKDDPSTSDADKEELTQEATRDCKAKINGIQFAERRDIYSHMVNETASFVVKDPALKDIYFDESGHVDIDKVNGTVRCLYGFAETVSTLGLERMSDEFIERLISM